MTWTIVLIVIGVFLAGIVVGYLLAGPEVWRPGKKEGFGV